MSDARLAARLATLSPAQRALVEERLRAARARAVAASAITRRDAPDAPLTPAQELLWRIAEASPGDAAYNVPRAVRITGPLDIPRLQQALDALVARHAALRTVIELRDGEPRQRTRAPGAVSLERIDLSATPEGERDETLRTVLMRAARAGFDLSSDLLLRATVVKLGAEDHVLLLASHHVASDGGSGGILFRDLASFYSAGSDAALPPLEVDFADYAAWLDRSLTPARRATLEAYWRGALHGPATLVALPTDRPRGSAPSFEGARFSFTFDVRTSDRVRELARRAATTPFAVLLAAYHTLLHRYSAQDDVVVGTVLSGRAHAELDGVVGYFSTALPIRASFTRDTTFVDVVRDVSEATRGAAEHADLPAETIAALVGQNASDAATTLFNTMFALVDQGASLPSLGGASLTELELDRGAAKFDLTLGMGFTDAGMRGVLEYRTDLFDASTIERIASHFSTLLDDAIENPATPVRRLALMGDPERRLVVETWNATDIVWPDDVALGALLAAQAEQSPDSIAIVSDGVTVTYAELNARAESVARFLRGRGVRPGDLVGISMERSPDLMVGLLGVLYAGAAYVPLDPDYPADRLAYMVEDSRVSLVLTQRRAAARLPDGSDATRVLLDDDWAMIESEARTVTGGHLDVDPSCFAYMIYTSGSTGRPKGALNTHRGIVNRLRWMQQTYALTPRDVVLQKTPISFDVSVWELFWPLLTGARLVLAAPGGHRDPGYLAETIRTHGVTVLHFVPSMLHAFLAEEAVGACAASMRDVMCSGEALTYDLQERFFARIPAARLHNLYGPTECAVDVTYWECVAGDPRRVVPIGRPVANTRMYVLDGLLQPTPIGVAGELYIAGVQVGAGYFNRPELTAERFVADPFARSGDARMYRTGDVARWLADGTLEYLGRTDHQIKLRGLRIELGEIEAALCAHPEVREAVVVAARDARDDVMLAAYFVAHAGASVTADALRAHLRRELPEYMVPAAFCEMETLPLTPTGKVDRKLLPAPVALAAEPRPRVAPRTPTEGLVLGIWQSVLANETFGVTDSFFDVGGNSLLAMRVVSRIAAATGVRLHFRLVFETPTVAALAAAVDRETADALHGRASGIAPRANDAPITATATQRMMWLHEQMSPAPGVYHVRLAFDLSGAVDVDAMRRAVVAVTARHDALRMSFEEMDGEPMVWVARDVDVTFDVRDVEPSDDALDRTLREEGVRPFDLERAPLFRVTMVRAGPRTRLLVVAHHLVFDGWSAGVFVRDLAAAYEVARQGTPPLLPLGIGFADVIAHENTSVDAGLLEFWRARLSDAPRAITLSRRAPDLLLDSAVGVRRTAALDDADAARFAAWCAEQGSSFFMGALAALDVVIHRHAGVDDIVVATPVAGRDRPETADMIGCLANTVLLRTRLDGDPTVEEVLARSRAACLDAYAHASLPLDRALSELRADGGSALRLQVMLVMQDDAPPPIAMGDTVLTPVELESGVASFEIKLSLTRTATGLRVALESARARVSDEDAEELLAAFVDALRTLPRSNGRRLSSLGDASRTDSASDATVAQAASESAAQYDALESVIGAVWCDVLRVQDVAPTTSFFDLGGHSLLATQVVARLGKLLRMRVPVRTFFEHPTVRGLADALARDPANGERTRQAADAVLRLMAMSAEERELLRASAAAGPTNERTL